MSDFNPSPIELTSIISRIIDGRERISSVLHSYRLPLDPSFSSTTIPLDKIDTIIPLQTSLKPEKNTIQSSITFEKLPVETNVKKSILFEKNELELKKEVETGEKNEEEPVLNLQHLAILKPALLEALANQEKLFRSRLQVSTENADRILDHLASVHTRAATRLSLMKREQRHIEARKIRLNKSSGKFERTIAKLGRVNSQMESDRQLLLSRISKPSWEIRHHYHMTAMEHFIGNNQPQLFEVAELIRGHLEIALMAKRTSMIPMQIAHAIESIKVSKVECVKELDDLTKHSEILATELRETEGVMAHILSILTNEGQYTGSAEEVPKKDLPEQSTFTNIMNIFKPSAPSSPPVKEKEKNPIKADVTKRKHAPDYQSIKMRYFENLMGSESNTLTPKLSSPATASTRLKHAMQPQQNLQQQKMMQLKMQMAQLQEEKELEDAALRGDTVKKPDSVIDVKDPNETKIEITSPLRNFGSPPKKGTHGISDMKSVALSPPRNGLPHHARSLSKEFSENNLKAKSTLGSVRTMPIVKTATRVASTSFTGNSRPAKLSNAISAIGPNNASKQVPNSMPARVQFSSSKPLEHLGHWATTHGSGMSDCREMETCLERLSEAKHERQSAWEHLEILLDTREHIRDQLAEHMISCEAVAYITPESDKPKHVASAYHELLKSHVSDDEEDEAEVAEESDAEEEIAFVPFHIRTSSMVSTNVLGTTPPPDSPLASPRSLFQFPIGLGREALLGDVLPPNLGVLQHHQGHQSSRSLKVTAIVRDTQNK